MGDILLAIPALRAMAARDVEVHLVIGKRWQALAGFLPAKVHVFAGTGGLIRLAAELKKLNARAVFDLQGKLSSIAIRTLVNAPITRSYQKRNLSEQFTAVRGKYPLRFTDQRPVWQKYASTCGVDVDNPDPSLTMTEAYIAECRQILKLNGLEEKKFIAIHPDASKPGKEIPPAIIAAIHGQASLPTTLIGTGTSAIPVSLPHTDLRNRFELYHLPGILSMAAAVISSDSGPMHLARAVNVPLVALFFQTCPSLGFAPVPASNVLLISRDLPCKPCSLHGQNENCPEEHFACRQLPAEETAGQIFSFLARFI